MKKLLIILLLSFSLYGQTINETFNDFGFDTTNAVAYYRFRGKVLGDTLDLSINDNVLTRAGGVGDSLITGSPVVSGEYATYFDDADYSYSVATTDVNIGPKTVYVVFKTVTTPATNDILIRYADNWYLGFSSPTNFRFWQDGNPDNYSVDYNASPYTSWQIFAIRFKSAAPDTLEVFKNGVHGAGNNNGAGAPNAASGTLYIGKNQYSQNWKGYLAAIMVVSNFDTNKKIKEQGFLANGWYSKNGGVTRSSFAFNQGIVADTIYCPISDGAVSGTVSAWSAAATPDLLVFNKAGDVQTISLTTTPTTYNISEITFAVSDSLYFSSSSTVYIDNVVLSESLIQTTKKRVYNNYNKYKGFK